ncbi:MAG: MFS transporter [Candidatus Omnitrophica bacterium]|nr:MFS transporter [Candidatus Omnitrophota bacterium]
MFSLLKERNFRLLWLGQICSQFGDRLTQLVLVAVVASQAAGSTLTLAKVMAVTSLPGLLINPFAGVYVDRWDRKQTMIICDLIRAGTIAGLPWLAGHSSSIPLYAGVFFLFSVAVFFVPARLAMIPAVVASKDLARANALFISSGMIGSALILLAGALLVEWLGVARSCWINGACYLASALFIMTIVRRREPKPSKPHSFCRVLKEIREGVQELWKHRVTRHATALVGLMTAGAGASFVAGTVMIQQLLGSVTRDLGFLSLSLGIGMLIGALVYGRWGTAASRRLILGLSFLGSAAALWLFIAAVAWLRSGGFACATVAFLGFWIAPVGIVANILVHEGHTGRLHGRIFSSIGVVMNLALIIAMLTAGWLAEQIGKETLLASVAGIFAFSGVLLLCYTEQRFQKS